MAVLTYAEFQTLVPSATGMDEARFDLVESAVESAVWLYLNRTLALSAQATEYYDYPSPGSRTEIVLNRRPVTAVAGVRIDPKGGGGQLSNTFGTDTALTAGEDYMYDGTKGTLSILNPFNAWPLTYYGSFYGYGQPYAYNTNYRYQNPLTIYVQYTAGYTVWPPDLKVAVAEICSWLITTGLESGGMGGVTHYIDVSMATGITMDALGYGNEPSLGTARQLLSGYREAPISRGRW